MKAKTWLSQAEKTLQTREASSARLDALVLLEDTVGRDRSWLLAHPEHKLDDKTLQTLNAQLERRCRHEPLAYIRGKSEFYGRKFIVNPHTLEPRPETETMIDLLKKLVDSRQPTADSKKDSEAQSNKQQVVSSKHHRTNDKKRLHGSNAMQGDGKQRTEVYMKYIDEAAQPATLQRAERTGSFSSLAAEQNSSPMSIIDVGTGSGCIAITAKLLYPHARVMATDIDKKCLDTARQNAKKLGASITFYHSNLLELLSNIKDQVSDIILANLPYVPDSHTINQAAQHEPHHAIFGGKDGLHYYREMFGQITGMPHKPRFILSEALPPQHDELTNIARKAGYQQVNKQDFIQVFSPATNKP